MALWELYEREYHVRRVYRIVVDRVVGPHVPSMAAQGFARIRIDVEPWEITARDVDSDAVAGLEAVRRRVGSDLECVDLTWCHELGAARGGSISTANVAVSEIHVESRRIVLAWRIYIDQLGGEVRVNGG